MRSWGYGGHDNADRRGVQSVAGAAVGRRGLGPAREGRILAHGADAERAGASRPRTTARTTRSTPSPRRSSRTTARSGSTERGEVDFAYSVPNVGRFRVNVFRQRGSISMVLRKLRFGGPSFEEIGLPDAVRTIADEHRGLILVTGSDRIGQDHDACSHDRLHQQDEAGPHRDDRGSHRGPAPRRDGLDQPARGRKRHRRTSWWPCAPRCARTPT